MRVLNLPVLPSGFVEAVGYIAKGFKLIAKGTNWFIYLPLNMFNVPIKPYTIQIIYYLVIGYIIYRLTRSITLTVIIMLVLSVVGAL